MTFLERIDNILGLEFRLSPVIKPLIIISFYLCMCCQLMNDSLMSLTSCMSCDRQMRIPPRIPSVSLGISSELKSKKIRMAVIYHGVVDWAHALL